MDAIKPRKSLVDETYDALLDSICTGELPAGERLNQDELAVKLNVSRQPVNSALAILKANGFVEDSGRRGVVVASLKPDQFHSIYAFRSVVEPFAVTLAAGAAMDTDRQREASQVLRNGQRAIESADVKALLQADMNFHEMIYRWSGNHVIENSMRVNWQHIRRCMAEVLKDPAAAIPTWKEHSLIVSHLIDGNVEASAHVMKAHIERAGGRTMQVLQDSGVERV
jgi:DNA-binding GntR family transcriptional regulator